MSLVNQTPRCQTGYETDDTHESFISNLFTDARNIRILLSRPVLRIMIVYENIFLHLSVHVPFIIILGMPLLLYRLSPILLNGFRWVFLLPSWVQWSEGGTTQKGTGLTPSPTPLRGFGTKKSPVCTSAVKGRRERQFNPGTQTQDQLPYIYFHYVGNGGPDRYSVGHVRKTSREKRDSSPKSSSFHLHNLLSSRCVLFSLDGSCREGDVTCHFPCSLSVNNPIRWLWPLQQTISSKRETQLMGLIVYLSL